MTPIRPIDAFPDNDNAVREDELQAYVDGQLGGRRRACIESYLAARPDEAARLAAYRKQNIGLHALFDPPPPKTRGGGNLPEGLTALAGRLDAQLRDSARPPARRGHGLRRLAASVVVMLSAGTAGWLALDQMAGRDDALVSLTRQAAVAPLQPIAATQGGERQVVAWLAAQPGNAPTTVPDLEALGFRLTSERLVTSADGHPAAQLLYRDEAGQRVTLVMRQGGKAGQASFTFARDGEAARFLWQDEHMAYSLSGAMAQEKLLQIAEAVSASLQKGVLPKVPQEAAGAEILPAPETDAGSLLPPVAPTAPTPAIDKIPLIPMPPVEAENLPKET